MFLQLHRQWGQLPTIQRYGLSSQGKPVGAGEENLGGRSTPMYVGIANYLLVMLLRLILQLQLADSDGFGLGDYITLGEEIMRVKANPSGNVLQVSRGQFSTPAQLVLLVRLFRRSTLCQWSYADTPFFVHLHIPLNT